MNPLEEDNPLSRRGFVVGTVGAAAIVGASATAFAQEDDDEDEGEDDENGDEEEEEAADDEEEDDENGDEDDEDEDDEDEDDEDEAPATGPTEVVEVGDNYFEPDDLAIEPGTTVRWEWVGDGHNIEPSGIPDESDWEGHMPLEDTGFEYEYTFNVEGDYHYVCTPHVGVGMVADIEVGEGLGETPDGPAELVPDAAWTLLIATTAGMVSTLSLVYFFMRFGDKSGE